MQASNKSDATQVYEGATRATQMGIKDSFKYLFKPLSIFGYHYFIEGIVAVQQDGPTRELEKITNLSYDETIRIMERCQKDGVRVVASERKLSTDDSEFGKKKSLFEQKRITRYSRRIKQLSNFKANYPNLSKFFKIDKFIKNNEKKQMIQVEQHKEKYYNIYFNKSKVAYLGDRIADLIEYRTGISQKLFDKNTQATIDAIKKEGMKLNSQQLKELSDSFKLHDIGSVEVEKFVKDYCIHEMSFSAFLNMQNDLEVADIPYAIRIITNDENEQRANIYFENAHLERYSELGFCSIGQIHVYGNDNKNMQWDIQSQDELVSFKTKVGEEEKQTYKILSGKNYIMKRQEDECVWTVFKEDLKELAEKEKKRDVVGEEIQKLNIFEQLEKDNNIEIPEIKEIDVKFEKEVGD